MAFCFALGPAENGQAHPQAAFSFTFRHAPGSYWSVTVKGFSLITLRMFGWHPSLVHQMECCQRAFPWKPRVRSVMTLGTRNIFSIGTQKSTFSSLFGTKTDDCSWCCTLHVTLVFKWLFYASHSILKYVLLEPHGHSIVEKTNSHMVFKKVLI